MEFAVNIEARPKFFGFAPNATRNPTNIWNVLGVSCVRSTNYNDDEEDTSHKLLRTPNV